MVLIDGVFKDSTYMRLQAGLHPHTERLSGCHFPAPGNGGVLALSTAVLSPDFLLESPGVHPITDLFKS